jgi:hypothetical protein
LLYYQAEQTGIKAYSDLFVAQILRVTFRKPQLPSSAMSILLLKKFQQILGASETIVTEDNSRQLAFVRYSTIGFTGIELNILADWLESPDFPIGMHSLLAQ